MHLLYIFSSIRSSYSRHFSWIYRVVLVLVSPHLIFWYNKGNGLHKTVQQFLYLFSDWLPSCANSLKSPTLVLFFRCPFMWVSPLQPDKIPASLVLVPMVSLHPIPACLTNYSSCPLTPRCCPVLLCRCRLCDPALEEFLDSWHCAFLDPELDKICWNSLPI